jgi:hypothetical protein
MPLDESEIGPYAGNGREDIVDGPLLPRAPYDEGAASFAQPSGLTTDGKQLFVADSEGSSVRAVPFDRGGQVTTVIGTAHLGSGRLFDFGDVDGRGSAPRLQHCLGVAFADNLLYVADTYNNKIKVIEPSTRTCTTLVGSGKSGHEDEPASFDEPAGLTAANHKLYVADTNSHLVRVVDLKNGNRVSTLTIAGLEPPKQSESAAEPSPEADAVALPTQMVRAEGDAVRVELRIHLPEKTKLNPLSAPRYKLEALGAQGPLDRAALGKPTRLEKPETSFEIAVPIRATTGADRLRLSLHYYYCQEGAEGYCKLGLARWDIPIELKPDAAQRSIVLEQWAK